MEEPGGRTAEGPLFPLPSLLMALYPTSSLPSIKLSTFPIALPNIRASHISQEEPYLEAPANIKVLNTLGVGTEV